MSDDARTKRITEEATTVKMSIARAKLYGEAVDMDSINAMLVAAYHLGLATARAMQKKAVENEQ